jgi:hypothetical protein
MTQLYVRVSGGSIVEGPMACPVSWANISGFDKAAWQEQAQHGWFRFEGGEDKPFDPLTQKAVWRVEFGPVVRSLCVIEPLSETEIAANLEEIRQQILARNAELRWQREVGGIEFFGVDREVPIPIHTDRDSQITIFAAALRGQDELWKGRDGNWYPFSAQDLALLSESIAQHKRICFETEAQFASMIRGCDSFADLDEIDLEALWNSE